MTVTITPLDEWIRKLPPQDAGEFLGQVTAAAYAALADPTPRERPRPMTPDEAAAVAKMTTPAKQSDQELLNVQQAAERMGVLPEWLCRNAKTLPFTRKLGHRTLRTPLPMHSTQSVARLSEQEHGFTVP